MPSQRRTSERLTDVRVRSAKEDEWADCVRLMLRRKTPDELSSAVADALTASERGDCPLDGLVVAMGPDDDLHGAQLLLLPGDGSGLVWPPAIAGGLIDPEAVATSLMTEVVARCEAACVHYAQCLCPIGGGGEPLLRRFGFRHVTNLVLLARLQDDFPTPSRFPIRRFDTFSEPLRDEWADLLVAAGQGSQDCPEASTLRTGREALTGHRSGSGFSSDLWRRYFVGDRPAGLVLLSSQASAVEIRYVAVIPGLRRRGLAAAMLKDAVADLSPRTSCLIVSCDERNTAAASLYASLGFEEQGRQELWLRTGG